MSLAPAEHTSQKHVTFPSSSTGEDGTECSFTSMAMASAAAPTGGQDDSAASFIGALISLTSHSNIRYQGILSNIDAAQATLSLENGT